MSAKRAARRRLQREQARRFRLWSKSITTMAEEKEDMGLVSKTEAERIEIPHEEGQWVKVRPLTWDQLKETRHQSSRQGMQNAEDLRAAAPELWKDLPAPDRSVKVVLNRDQEYDRTSVIKLGLDSWSYTEGNVEVESISDLDGKTSRWIFDEILDRSIIDDEEGEG